MTRFLGGVFGNTAPSSAPAPTTTGVYDYNGQYYVKQEGGWTANIEATGGNQSSPTGDPLTGAPTPTNPNGNWKYHVFTGPGTFTCTANSGFVEYLVVAGGGGGGEQTGGGGGAGGLRTNVAGVEDAAGNPLTISTPFPVSPTGGNGSGAYTVTVGGGGEGSPPGPSQSFPAGADGGDSYFGPPSSPDGITATGGGGGGAHRSTSDNPVKYGKPGGSGGGSCMFASPPSVSYTHLTMPTTHYV